MTPENVLCIILALVVGEFILTKTLGYLNHRNKTPELPEELQEVYDEEKYEKSLKYENTKYKFGLLSSGLSIVVTLLMLTLGGFGWLDEFVRQFTDNVIVLALYFF